MPVLAFAVRFFATFRGLAFTLAETFLFRLSESEMLRLSESEMLSSSSSLPKGKLTLLRSVVMSWFGKLPLACLLTTGKSRRSRDMFQAETHEPCCTRPQVAGLRPAAYIWMGAFCWSWHHGAPVCLADCRAGSGTRAGTSASVPSSRVVPACCRRGVRALPRRQLLP